MSGVRAARSSGRDLCHVRSLPCEALSTGRPYAPRAAADARPRNIVLAFWCLLWLAAIMHGHVLQVPELYAIIIVYRPIFGPIGPIPVRILVELGSILELSSIIISTR